MTKVYLGDSVYAEFDGERITLTTSNGIVTNNTIVLLPAVQVALVRFIESIVYEPVENAHKNTAG